MANLSKITSFTIASFTSMYCWETTSHWSGLLVTGRMKLTGSSTPNQYSSRLQWIYSSVLEFSNDVNVVYPIGETGIKWKQTGRI